MDKRIVFGRHVAEIPAVPGLHRMENASDRDAVFRDINAGCRSSRKCLPGIPQQYGILCGSITTAVIGFAPGIAKVIERGPYQAG